MCLLTFQYLVIGVGKKLRMILRSMKELKMLPTENEETQNQRQEEQRDPQDIEQGAMVCLYSNMCTCRVAELPRWAEILEMLFQVVSFVVLFHVQEQDLPSTFVLCANTSKVLEAWYVRLLSRYSG
jgi:hypothetical protein